ncbi:hypothetical protein ACLB2K_047462 [Fragaria x ananassa]
MAYQPLPGRNSVSSSSSGASGFHFINSSPFGDTTYTKLFVGGLAWETQSDIMGRYFEQFGQILEAVVISDKNTGRSKGYGFVTFQEPEAAARACADPTPVIDGRRANCNLASLRRPRPPMSYVRTGPASPYIGSMQSTHGAYVGAYGYQQPLPYNYQQPMMFPPYGYATYGPEYVYSQGANNSYAGQQYVPIYGVPGTVNPLYSYAQLGQTIPSGQGYPTVHRYAMPAQQMIPFVPGVNAVTTTPVPTIQAPYSADSFIAFIRYSLTAAGLRAAELLLRWWTTDLALQFLILHSRGHSYHAHQRTQMAESLQIAEKEGCYSLEDASSAYLNHHYFVT